MIATIPIGQAPQAVVYVPNAVPEGDGTQNLQPLGLAANAVNLQLVDNKKEKDGNAPTNVTLFDQGLLQVLQASVTGLDPKTEYVLALSTTPDGKGELQPLSSFKTNPGGSAIVNALGPIRQIVQNAEKSQRRYLVIAAAGEEGPGDVVQTQTK